MRIVVVVAALSPVVIFDWLSNVDGEEDAGEQSPSAGDVLMLAVPNFTSSNSNQDMQEAALLLTKLMTPLRQSNITPLSFVSLQLEKVVCLVTCQSHLIDSVNSRLHCKNQCYFQWQSWGM